MLIYKGEKNQFRVRYNGTDKELSPGQKLDVRDFDILTKNVKGVETHFMKKHPGLFDQSATVDSPSVKAEYDEQIKGLMKENEDLVQLVNKYEKVATENAKKLQSMSEEISGFSSTERSLRSEIKELKKKIKDQDEEHEAHVKRVLGGKSK